VRWDATHAQEIYLDGESVGASGSRQVCPTTSQEHDLRVVNDAGEQTYTLVLGVTGVAPADASTPQSTAVPPTSPAAQPTADTSQPDAAPSPTPAPTVQPVAAAPPSPTSARDAQPEASSPTSAPPPTHTPSAVALAQPATGAQETAPRDEKDSVSAMVPIGYIVFALVVGGLSGWLVFEIQRRK
jgi:cobalamin biosynthesis Mg chelatase CobN